MWAWRGGVTVGAKSVGVAVSGGKVRGRALLGSRKDAIGGGAIPPLVHTLVVPGEYKRRCHLHLGQLTSS